MQEKMSISPEGKLSPELKPHNLPSIHVMVSMDDDDFLAVMTGEKESLTLTTTPTGKGVIYERELTKSDLIACLVNGLKVKYPQNDFRSLLTKLVYGSDITEYIEEPTQAETAKWEKMREVAQGMAISRFLRIPDGALPEGMTAGTVTKSGKTLI